MRSGINSTGKKVANQLSGTSWQLLQEYFAAGENKGVGSLSSLEGGGVLERFEKAFASLAGAPYALAVSSGTAALHTALLACDIGSGDEVIVSPYGWGQTVGAVMMTGATPVFADIDPFSGNLDPAMLRSRLSSNTRAILVTHVHGLPADMRGLMEITREHGIKLIADAAQALGASFAGLPIGAWGDITCFSLGRGKAICTGEGGVVVSANTDLLERMMLVSQHPLRCFRDVESVELYDSVTELGCSYRMTPYAAAIALGQIESVGMLIAAKRDVAGVMSSRLRHVQGLKLPDDTEEAFHAFYFYVAQITSETQMEKLLAVVEDLDIGLQAGPIATPIHFRPPFSGKQAWLPKALCNIAPHASWRPGSCPQAELRCKAGNLYVNPTDLLCEQDKTGSLR